MGGSGGGGWSPSDVSRLKVELEKSTETSTNAAYEAEVAGKLNEFLIQFNGRDAESIKARLDEIKEKLATEIGEVQLGFGGSVKKHTFIDGLSDVDALVYVHDSELADRSPEAVRRAFISKLKNSLEDVEAIENGRLAVTLTYEDGTVVQLLPALKTDTGLHIPSQDGSQWSNINPDGFTRKLSTENAKLQGKLVPTIKLAKAINSQVPEKYQLSGYHIEALAIAVFSTYDGPATPKAMLEHFFRAGASRVLSPIADRTGQSIHVDEDLGPKGSVERKAVSYQLELVSRKLALANKRESLELWTGVFGDLDE